MVVDTSTADPLLGRRLDGRYRIDARVARGGMATVYTGVDLRLDRVVAVKVMHPALAEDDAFVARFGREARAAAKLSHPNVVAIFDQGEDDGSAYLVMEHVDGRTLRALLRERRLLSPADALAILDGVLEALAAAHAAGIVHRDIKPENVLLSGDRVKVADFGLARAIESPNHTVADGTLIGTVAYLAPEQVVDGAADARTDLYAAGVMLYELVTGTAPFRGDNPIAVAYRHVNEDVPPTGVSPELDEIVHRATRRDPAARYGDANAMLAAVRRVRATAGPLTTTAILPAGSSDDAPTLVTPLPPKQMPFTPPKRRTRKPLVISLIVALVLGVAAGTGWWLGTGRYVDAPQLVGLDEAGVRRVAAEQEIDVRFGDPVFSEEYDAGEVADQDPDPGDRLRRGGTVTVVLSRGQDRLTLADVRDKTEAEARAALPRTKVEVTRAFHDTVRDGRVVSQDPVHGTVVKPGTTVRLVVSRGPEPVTVPRVVELTEAKAVEALKTAGLKAEIAREYDRRVPEGTVVSQQVAPGTTVGRGSTVRITVSKGPPLVVVPDVYDMLRDDAIRRLQRDGFKVRTEDFSGRRGRRVIDQSPPAGTRAPEGSTVTIYLV